MPFFLSRQFLLNFRRFKSEVQHSALKSYHYGLLKGVLLFVRLDLRVGTGKRAGKEELDGTWRSQR